MNIKYRSINQSLKHKKMILKGQLENLKYKRKFIKVKKSLRTSFSIIISSKPSFKNFTHLTEPVNAYQYQSFDEWA